MNEKSIVNRPTLCISLLDTFTEKQLVAFNKVLISPYFNSDEQLIRLLRAIKKYALRKNVYDDTIKIRVYNFTYDTKYAQLNNNHKKSLNLKMNSLLRLIEKFLCLQKMEENAWSKLDLLYPKLIEHKQYHLFNKHFRKDEKALKEQKIIDERYYERMYKLYEQKVEVQFHTGEIIKQDHIQEVIDFLDLNFLTKKLNDFTSIKSLIDTYKKNYDLISYSQINSLSNSERFEHNKKLNLLKSYYNFIKSKTETSYNEFISNLNKAKNYTSNEELFDFYGTSINYCAQMVRAGHPNYKNEMFLHYKSMIEKKLLLKNGLISPLSYANIIALSCELNELKWSKKFADDFKKNIRKELKVMIYSYGLGLISFTEKKFNEAHEYFYNVYKTNTQLDFKARVYILKCMYEERIEYSYEFSQAIKSAANFINLQKNVPKNRKRSYINFTKLLQQLYNYSFQQGKFKLSTIKQNIKSQKLLTDRGWIIEKIKELNNA